MDRAGGRPGRGPGSVRSLAAHQRASPGPEHPHTLNDRSNLARWTGEAGDPAGAHDQLAALLPILERFYGPEHPETRATRDNLAYWIGQAEDAALDAT